MSKLKSLLPLILILLVALVFRLPLLNGSFWLDEAAQALESSRPLGEQLKIQDDFQPPLLHLIVHFMLVGGRSEAWLRSISLVSGLMTIVFIYLIVKEIADEKAALLAAFLLAINPFHLFFSQELRPYALAAMFAVVSWWAILRSGSKGKGARSIFFILATVGGLYSMYLYPFVMLSQVIYFWLEKRSDFRRILILFLISCLCFLPWVPSFLGQLQVGTALTGSLPGWSQVVATPQLKALPMVFAKFIVGQVALKDSFLYYGLAGIVGIVLLVACIHLWKEKKSRYLLYWLFVTVVGAWLISFVVPVIQPKRVMTALPAMTAVLATWVMGQGSSSKWKKAAIIIVAAIFLLCDVLYWVSPKYQRENWRALVHDVEANAVQRKSAALFVFPEPFAPWRWYSTGTVPSLATKTLLIKDKSQLYQNIGNLHDYKRIFAFDYLADLSDPGNLTQSWLKDNGYQELRAIDGGNAGFVRVFDSL